MYKSITHSENIILFKLTLIGLLVFKLSSFKLWVISDRILPVVSVSNFIEITDEIFHNTTSIVSLIIISILIFRVYKILIIPLILLEFLLLATDVMRWQPAVYQYFLSIIIFRFYPKHFKSYLLLLLSAMYFFAGLHKFDLNFINTNWSRTILLRFLEIPYQYINLKAVKAMGFVIPIIEIASGILLLTRWRKKALLLIILSHIFIIAFILKLGSFENLAFSVLSWNLVLLSYALLYFYYPKCKKLERRPAFFIWVVLLYILPFLNLFGKYYPYLSFDIYSGAKFVLYLNVKPENANKIGTYTENKNTTLLSENVNLLASNELRVPLTHNQWLYRRFIKSFKRDFPQSTPCFEISYYPFKSKMLFE